MPSLLANFPRNPLPRADTSVQSYTQQGNDLAWVLGGAALDLWFAQGRYYPYPDPRGFLTVTRASSNNYAQWSSGVWQTFAPATPRITDQGLLVEEARTNSALRARDFTQAAWVATSVTTALNAAGFDNAANAATTLTASGANGTILQAVSLSAASFSVFVKRVTGTGEVDITVDGGTTWTNIASSLTTNSFFRASLLNATISSIGLRIVTSGDAVIVDCAQAEVGTYVTSPIITTSATVTRNVDVVTYKAPPTIGSSITLYGLATPQAPAAYAANQAVVAIDDNSNSNFFMLRRSAAGNALAVNGNGGTATTTGATAWTQGVQGKLAASDTGTAQLLSFNGAATASGAGTFPAGLANIRIGSLAGAGAMPFDGYIARVAIWPTTAMSSAQLQLL